MPSSISICHLQYGKQQQLVNAEAKPLFAPAEVSKTISLHVAKIAFSKYLLFFIF